jgi:hypothetical protein
MDSSKNGGKEESTTHYRKFSNVTMEIKDVGDGVFFFGSACGSSPQ